MQARLFASSHFITFVGFKCVPFIVCHEIRRISSKKQDEICGVWRSQLLHNLVMLADEDRKKSSVSFSAGCMPFNVFYAIH
jgi:hypothetical protein